MVITLPSDADIYMTIWRLCHILVFGAVPITDAMWCYSVHDHSQGPLFVMIHPPRGDELDAVRHRTILVILP
jgi:hypothetical protein